MEGASVITCPLPLVQEPPPLFPTEGGRPTFVTTCSVTDSVLIIEARVPFASSCIICSRSSVLYMPCMLNIFI